MTFVELPSLGGRDAERPGVTPTQSVGARCQSRTRTRSHADR